MTKHGNIEHTTNENQLQKFKIKSKGIYVITASSYLYAKGSFMLKVNNKILAQGTAFSTSSGSSPSIIHTLLLGENDIIEFTITTTLKGLDTSLSIFKI